jgi:hypothetical protein
MRNLAAGNHSAHAGCTRTPRRDHTRGFLAHETVKDSSERRKNVVEHKGSINFGSQALVLLRAQSLTWDTLCADISRISLAVAYLQLMQELAWDTLSHLKYLMKSQEISITFWFPMRSGRLDTVRKVSCEFCRNSCPGQSQTRSPKKLVPMRLSRGLQDRGAEMSNGIIEGNGVTHTLNCTRSAPVNGFCTRLGQVVSGAQNQGSGVEMEETQRW